MPGRFSQKFPVQLILLFGGFAACRILCNGVFFEGFLTTFRNVNGFFSLSKNALFAHDPFHSSSIILSALAQPYFLLLLVLLYVPFVIKRKELKQRFTEIPQWERIIPFAAAMLLAWELTTYDYNYYLDRAFYFDRILLVALAVLILRRPVFVPLFLASSFVYRAQFNYPVDGFPLFDKRLLFDLPEIFLVYIYLKLFIREFRVPFLFATLCIVGGNYFMSFVGKILISPHGYEWLWYDRVSDLFANVHQRGWITNENTFHSMFSFLRKFDGVFRVLILLVEFLGLLLLLRRKWSAWFLSGFFIMHIGIFIFGSMLFWKWMAIDLLLVFILIRYRSQTEEIFSRRFFFASLVVIAASFIWLQPYRIAWWDTKWNQYFTYEIVDDSGKTYSVDKNMLEPYHQWFEYDKMLFIRNEPSLRITGFGYAPSLSIRTKLDSLSADGFPYIPKDAFRNEYNAHKRAMFEDFIRTYFSARNKRTGSVFLPALLHAPDHVHSSAPSPCYDGTQHVKLFRVIFNLTAHDNETSFPFAGEVMDEIVIDP